MCHFLVCLLIINRFVFLIMALFMGKFYYLVIVTNSQLDGCRLSARKGTLKHKSKILLWTRMA